MRIALDQLQGKVPLPATERWPQGVWDIEALAHSTMSVIYFAPSGTDYQTSHQQDELYIVLSGSGVLVIEGQRVAFQPGDVLFVKATKKHPFEDFSDDLATWAIF